MFILSCTLNDACIDSAKKMLKLSILVLRILKRIVTISGL